jgi:glucokinase
MSTLGIDIGGTKVAMGLVDEEGRVSHKQTFATEPAKGADHLKERLVARVAEYRVNTELCAVGIGFPGAISQTARRILTSVNLPDWEGVALGELFPAEWSLPIYADNDANAAAVGEWMHGAGKGTTDFIYLTLSTGIGAGIIANGRLLRGHRGYAGEVGQTLLDSGNKRCWESLAAGPAIAQAAKEALIEEPGGLIYELAGADPEKITAKTVLEAFSSGDEMAMGILKQTAFWTGVGLCNLCLTVNPERIAIGGGLGCSSNEYLGMIQDAFTSCCTDHQIRPEIVMAHLGDESGIIGSASLAIKGTSE